MTWLIYTAYIYYTFPLYIQLLYPRIILRQFTNEIVQNISIKNMKSKSVHRKLIFLGGGWGRVLIAICSVQSHFEFI